MASLVIDEVPAQFMVSAWLARLAPDRTPGIHVSDVIADLVRTVPSLAKNLDLEDDVREAMFSLGLGWEGAVGAFTTGIRAPSLVVDGIICSVDYLNPFEGLVEECKFTWKSVKWDIRDNWRWMTQVKAYCYAWKVDTAKFWVCHCNNDYHPPSPKTYTYTLKFAPIEIEENWFMLSQHASYMREREAMKGLN